MYVSNSLRRRSASRDRGFLSVARSIVGAADPFTVAQIAGVFLLSIYGINFLGDWAAGTPIEGLIMEQQELPGKAAEPFVLEG